MPDWRAALKWASSVTEIWNANYSHVVSTVQILVCKSSEEILSQWITFLADWTRELRFFLFVFIKETGNGCVAVEIITSQTVTF